jgi:rare lipoprotein A
VTAALVVALAASTTPAARPSTTAAIPPVIPWDPHLPPVDAPPPDEFGLASWYGDFHHGLPTANGERFDQWALPAAHPTLPLGTRVQVTNIGNGRHVNVRINDRGPMIRGRIVDLSRAAADRIGPVEAGVVRVRVRPIELRAYRRG